MILVITSVAMTGFAKMLLNSFVIFRGSTIVTCTGKKDGTHVTRILQLYEAIVSEHTHA